MSLGELLLVGVTIPAVSSAFTSRASSSPAGQIELRISSGVLAMIGRGVACTANAFEDAVLREHSLAHR